MKDKPKGKSVQPAPTMTRAEFLSLAGRAAAGIGLAALLLKLGGLFPGDKKRAFTVCTANGICARCGTVRSCELPQALSYRLAKGGKS
jgi:hypothetical protein